jgi:F420-dependent oxidoreductase-like protein
MTQIGIMIEGQDGLNWDRWKRLVQAAEDFGYQSLFRSDHFTNASPPDKDALELWISLTYAASHSERIEFGSLVSPVTFRHPSVSARMAAQVDDLSDGRLVYGMGAGWQEREHRKFGVPFYDFPTRYDMLEDALEITTRLFNSDEPVTYNGQHFSLDEALLLPRPQREGGPPILIGGLGPKRTLPLVAQYADEWNAVFPSLDVFRDRSQLLDRLLAEHGREPSDVKRSVMIGVHYARDDADVQRVLDDFHQRTDREFTLDELAERGRFVGTASMLIDRISPYVELGAERMMLQWLALDDIDGLELMARDILPHFHQ